VNQYREDVKITTIIGYNQTNAGCRIQKFPPRQTKKAMVRRAYPKIAFLFLGGTEMSTKSSASFSPAISFKSASHLGQLRLAKIVEVFPKPTF